jgi:hypothetical protein
MILVASHYGVQTTQYVALFPLVILTNLVERFWTVEAEDSTAASFRTLVGTFAVALLVTLALSPPAVGTWMFCYPETLGLVLALQLLLGRYTGYRLIELYRFDDLIREDALSGEDHDLVAALAAPEAAGDSGDEPAQCYVHSGSQSAPVFPARRPQEPDGRFMPGDPRADP